jgi:uncharacterized protein
MAQSFFSRILHQWQAVLSIHRWVAFVLPLAVYMLIGSFEPTDPGSAMYRFYPWIYFFKLLATLAALRVVWPVYKSMIRPIRWHGIAIGIVGAAVWIGVCRLELERTYLLPLIQPLGLDHFLSSPTRSAFNPFVELSGYPIGIAMYLLIRGLGLALLVPIIEEYFLRGFVMRYVAADKWWKFPIGSVTRNSLIAGTLVPMLMHPSELIAAGIWFSLITLLYMRSKNLWECIAAHSVTNLLIGIYVVLFGAWQLV